MSKEKEDNKVLAFLVDFAAGGVSGNDFFSLCKSFL